MREEFSDPLICFDVLHILRMIPKRLERCDLGRRIDISQLDRQVILSDEVIQAKVFLTVEKEGFLEENQQRPANPESASFGDDHKIDIAVLACDPLREFA